MHIKELSESSYVDLAEQGTFLSQLDLGVAIVSHFNIAGVETILISTSSGTYGQVLSAEV